MGLSQATLETYGFINETDMSMSDKSGFHARSILRDFFRILYMVLRFNLWSFLHENIPRDQDYRFRVRCSRKDVAVQADSRDFQHLLDPGRSGTQPPLKNQSPKPLALNATKIEVPRRSRLKLVVSISDTSKRLRSGIPSGFQRRNSEYIIFQARMEDPVSTKPRQACAVQPSTPKELKAATPRSSLTNSRESSLGFSLFPRFCSFPRAKRFVYTPRNFFGIPEKPRAIYVRLPPPPKKLKSTTPPPSLSNSLNASPFTQTSEDLKIATPHLLFSKTAGKNLFPPSLEKPNNKPLTPSFDPFGSLPSPQKISRSEEKAFIFTKNPKFPIPTTGMSQSSNLEIDKEDQRIPQADDQLESKLQHHEPSVFAPANSNSSLLNPSLKTGKAPIFTFTAGNEEMPPLAERRALDLGTS